MLPQTESSCKSNEKSNPRGRQSLKELEHRSLIPGREGTHEPPLTPSFSHSAPYLSLSRGIDVAWPPVIDIRSIIVTLSLSGCWANVAAHDCNRKSARISQQDYHEQGKCSTASTPALGIVFLFHDLTAVKRTLVDSCPIGEHGLPFQPRRLRQ